MKVHLGCYDLIKPGWLNIDIQQVHAESPEFMKWDLRNGLPDVVQDLTMSYSSHFMEHILWGDAVKLLRDLYNRTVVGGKTRHCIPDFEKLVTKYLAKDWDFFSHCLSIAPNHQLMEIIGYSIYQRDDGVNAEHVCMYDSEYAIFTLEQAGFKNCKRVEFNPELDYGFRVPYSFFVEGTRLD